MTRLLTLSGGAARGIFLFIAVLSALGVLLFIASGVCTTFNVGNFAGLFVSAVLFLLSAFRFKAAGLILRLEMTAPGKALVTAFYVIAAVCVITGIVISVFMIRAADRPIEGCETVIVLGCRVKPEGPSLMLQNRINAAYKYLSENENALCIASGGQGADEPVTEAAAIKKALVDMGISPDRIIEEDRSENTFQNIRNSLEIIDSLSLPRRAVIVTSEFQQLRAMLLCNKQGLETGSVSSRTNPFLLPSYWIREWFGVVHELVIGRS